MNPFSVGLFTFSLICGCMVLHRVKTGLWMCDQAGVGGNSLQVYPLCERHPASTHTVGLHSTWTAEMSFAGVALSHIPPILIFWVLLYSCGILLAFGLYSPCGFLSPLCLSSTTEHEGSEQQQPHALNTHKLYWHTFWLLLSLFWGWPWSSVSVFFAVWFLREWTHHSCEDGIAGVAEICKSLWRVFYKDGLYFQRILRNSAVIQG